MRGWASVAALALLLVAMPVLAQRGGGHASGGHGGFGGHVSGGSHFGGGSGMSSRGFSSSGSHQSFSHPSFSRQPYAHPPASSFVRPGYAGSRGRGSGVTARNRVRGSGFRNFGVRNRGLGYPWGYTGFYDPYWWWDSDSGSSRDQDYYNDRAYADQMNQQSLEQQEMRQQRDQDLYAQAAAPPSQNADPTPAEVIPPTVLIFRDQRKEEIHNYAIVGQTLWNFAPQRTEKIQLSDLDLSATAKANGDRGVDFRLPNAPEGQ